VPGGAREAEPDYETLAQVNLLVPSAFRGYVRARHPALRYGLTLNDRSYFWEAREILEAVWAAAPQGGRERILLRACILIANGNLRLRMERGGSAARLFGEALTELQALGQRKSTASGNGFADSFPIDALAATLKTRQERPNLGKADWVSLVDEGVIWTRRAALARRPC
jgi:hypothetical protein